MTNMKYVTIVTVILMISVAMLHDMAIFTKFLIGSILFVGWALFAIGRAAQERRRAKRAQDAG
ncbi:MAG: hypothetical protein CTY15_02965 [Methylocystis sp.]|nr:MAG: hypothetical protein CTY15_02965 [Methylocystis sp.]